MTALVERPAIGEPVMEASGIRRSFGNHLALDDVDLTLHTGESVALVGENGAGKSTLAKILTGALRPDDGALRVRGQVVRFGSPRDAIAAGIAFIPQELAYVPRMSVGENILLNRWPSWRGMTNRRAIRRSAADALRDFGVELDVDAPLSELKLADRQLVEIVKALARRASVVVLDEPTAALSDRESEALFRALRRLKQDGVACVSVLHRIDHVQGIADRVLVLRNGRAVLSAPRGTSRADLVAAMLGPEVAAVETRARASLPRPRAGEVALLGTGLTTTGNPGLRDVDLDARRGEILVVFGVRGSGIEHVGGVLSGRTRLESGSLRIGGREYDGLGSPRAARRAGIGFVPPERKTQGLVLGLSIAANISLLTLSRVSRLGFLSRRAERSLAQKLSASVDVRAQSTQQAVGELSGGNQQKVLLASRLAAGPDLLVLEQPTRGVDIGARAQIHAHLRALAESGMTFIVITSDVEEAVIMGDRVVVVRDGDVVDELAGQRCTQQAVLRAASGGE